MANPSTNPLRLAKATVSNKPIMGEREGFKIFIVVRKSVDKYIFLLLFCDEKNCEREFNLQKVKVGGSF